MTMKHENNVISLSMLVGVLEPSLAARGFMRDDSNQFKRICIDAEHIIKVDRRPKFGGFSEFQIRFIRNFRGSTEEMYPDFIFQEFYKRKKYWMSTFPGRWEFRSLNELNVKAKKMTEYVDFYGIRFFESFDK